MDRVHVGHVLFNISYFDCGIQVKVLDRHGKACCAKSTAARRGSVVASVTKLQRGMGVTSNIWGVHLTLFGFDRSSYEFTFHVSSMTTAYTTSFKEM